MSSDPNWHEGIEPVTVSDIAGYFENDEIWYLASPYSKYPGGIHEAFEEVCRYSAELVKAGVPHFCPIAQSHAVAMHGDVDPLDHDIWLPVDKPVLRKTSGMLIADMDTWRESYGIQQEFETLVNDTMNPVFVLHV